VSLEKRLERRYWLVGIVCSLVFHGAVIFLPLHLAPGRNVLPQSLRIRVVGQASSDVARGAKAEVHRPAQVEGTTSQVPVIPPVQPSEAPASASEGQSVSEAQLVGEGKEESPAGWAQAEGYVLPRETAASAAAPTSQGQISLLPNFSAAVEDGHGGALQDIVNALDVSLGQGRRGPEGMPPGAPRGHAFDPEPTMPPYPVAPRADAAKEEERAPSGAAATGTSVPEPSAQIAAAKTAAPADAARRPEVDAPAMERASAPVPTKAPRQYFAPSKELFAKVHAAPGTSAAHAGEAGATVPAKSDAVAAPDAGHAASAQAEEGWTSPSSQAAELKAEKLRSYKEMRYSNAAAAQGISQPRAEDNAAKQAAQGGDAVKAAGPEPRAEDAAVQHRGEDGIARHAEDASVVPDQKQPSDGLGRVAEVASPSQSESPSFPKPGALTPQPSVADQTPPLAPPDREGKAAPAAPSGARDAQTLAVAQAPQFDTPETLSQQIIAALSARKEYPAAALRRKTEGVVKLSLVVAPDGSLIKASIQSPSGSSVLDEAAMRLVQGIFPLKVRLASAVSLVVPVEYRIPK